jgi:hypothetical protein
MWCVGEGVEGNLSASEFLDSYLPSFLIFQIVSQVIKCMAKLGRILKKQTTMMYMIVRVHVHVALSSRSTCCVLEKKEEMSSRAVILKYSRFSDEPITSSNAKRTQ